MEKILNIRKVIHEVEVLKLLNYELTFPKGSSYRISQVLPNIEKRTMQFKQIHFYKIACVN
jgi:hypothetical protein